MNNTFKKRKDLKGLKFNKWNVIDFSRSRVMGNQTKAYWLCECDCGTKKEVYANSLVSGKSNSCGCYKKKLAKGIQARNNIYSTYRCKSKRMNLDFCLSKEEFSNITQLNCYYCNLGPSNIHQRRGKYGEFKYNGIDRVDSNKGYILTNIVPCCKNCNLAKNKLPEQVFLNMIKLIYEHRKLNEIT